MKKTPTRCDATSVQFKQNPVKEHGYILDGFVVSELEVDLPTENKYDETFCLEIKNKKASINES
tara:strand:+ start:986 stop:1177 length:192 start_codon:yes stop_codon:yes gene_type:complete